MNLARKIYIGLWVVLNVAAFSLLSWQWASILTAFVYLMTFFKAMVEHGELFFEMRELQVMATATMELQAARIAELEAELEAVPLTK